MARKGQTVTSIFIKGDRLMFFKRMFFVGLILCVGALVMISGCETLKITSPPVVGSVAKPNAVEEADFIISSRHIQKQMLGEHSFALPRGMSSVSVFLFPIEGNLEVSLKKFERKQSGNYFQGYSYLRTVRGVEDIGDVRVVSLVYSINSNSRPATLVVFPGTGTVLGILTSGTSTDLTKIPAIVAAKTFTGKKLVQN